MFSTINNSALLRHRLNRCAKLPQITLHSLYTAPFHRAHMSPHCVVFILDRIHVCITKLFQHDNINCSFVTRCGHWMLIATFRLLTVSLQAVGSKKLKNQQLKIILHLKNTNIPLRQRCSVAFPYFIRI